VNVEKLAMLTPKSLDLDHIPGGIAELTQMDIAGALHKLDKFEHELLRVKYCGDPAHGLYASCLMWAMEQDWDLPRGKTDATVMFALSEAVGSNRCSSCNGVSELEIDNKIEVCPACNGAGVQYEQPPEGCADAVEKLRKKLHQVEYAAIAKIDC